MTSKPQPLPLDTDDVQNAKFAASAFDFLLIELVPLAQRITEQVQAREQALLNESKKRTAQKEEGETGATTTTATTCLGFPNVADETREAMFLRLDGLGYRVGQGLAERFSANKPRPTTPLDAIKFICKDLWTQIYRKQIDNLKTNHRGVFVLTDARFAGLSRVSIDRRAGGKASEEAGARALLCLYFPGGVIRGALAALGVEASVGVEVPEIPAAVFQIKTKGAKA